MQEARRFHAPILLVACKSDLASADLDEELFSPITDLTKGVKICSAKENTGNSGPKFKVNSGITPVFNRALSLAYKYKRECFEHGEIIPLPQVQNYIT